VLYIFLRSIGCLLCRGLFNLKARGLENIPSEGGAIIAANHSSYLDPVILSAAVPRKIVWVVSKDVYDIWWLKLLFRATGMIRVNGSVDKAVSVLKEGKLVGIFPEGSRSFDGRLKAAKDGVAVIAKGSGMPVIPCLIRGAFEAYPRGAVFPRIHAVEVVAGTPLKFITGASGCREFTDKIMSAIAALP
jgi:1-acyl-sn-glycerol-3-phosphate acyltransferase